MPRRVRDSADVSAVVHNRRMNVGEAVDAHLRDRLGPPSRSASFKWDSQVVAVSKWDADRTNEGVDLYVTNGAALLEDAHAVEFFVGLTPGRDEIAGPLAGLHHYQLEHGVSLGHGHTVPMDQPVWPGTSLDSLLILRQARAIIEHLNEGAVHVEFMQVIPTTGSERQTVHRMGIDAFLADWEARQVPFWDSSRA
jgi:hypothetical protein